jgi:hypothetical protein
MDKERVWDAVKFYLPGLETVARELMRTWNK